MNVAQRQRAFKNAARAIASNLVDPAREKELRCNADYQHFRTRFSTLQVLLTDEVEALEKEPSRNHALALILVTDFCWQVLRGLGDLQGKDMDWLLSVLPSDYEENDRDIGNGHFQIQKEIIDDANWVFGLHSSLRHPARSNDDMLGLMREPVDETFRSHLLKAAKGVQQVLTLVQRRLDPTITVASEPVSRP